MISATFSLIFFDDQGEMRMQVAVACHKTMWLFEVLLKQAAALSGLDQGFSDNEFAGLMGALVAMSDQEGLLHDANAANVLSLVLQAWPPVLSAFCKSPCTSQAAASGCMKTQQSLFY